MTKTKDSKVISILKRLGRPPEERTRLSGILTGPEEMVGFQISKLPNGSEGAARLMRELGENNLTIKFIVHHFNPGGDSNLLLCVEQEKLDPARDILESFLEDLPGSLLKVLLSIQVVSLYPHREDPSVPGEALNALREVGIECLAVGAASSVISLVVAQEDLSLAVETLKNTFQVA